MHVVKGQSIFQINQQMFKVYFFLLTQVSGQKEKFQCKLGKINK